MPQMCTSFIKRILLNRRYFSSQARSNNWEAVIGLEFHAQIASESKLFSRTPVSVFAPPNTAVGWFDSAHPGTLPQLNRKVVESALKAAVALKAKINKVSHFDRKHYFYPDLPAGYQITQQRVPLAEEGELSFIVVPEEGAPYVHSAQLERLHIEEDSGRSIHDKENNRVLVDLNRAGIGLVEFVFAPCLRSAAEAVALTRRLSNLLGTLGVCSSKLSDSALRVDTNVSVRRKGEPFGVRTEIKNLNSTKILQDAITHEVSRHISLLENGACVVSETRGYSEERQCTVKLRGKEGLQDYRFLPEPNLPPLHVTDSRDLKDTDGNLKDTDGNLNDTDGNLKDTDGNLKDTDGNFKDTGGNLKDIIDVHSLRKGLPRLPKIDGPTLHLLLMTYGLSLELSEQLIMEPLVLSLYLSSCSLVAESQPGSEGVYSSVAKSLLTTWQAMDETQKTNWRLTPSAVCDICRLQTSGRITGVTAVKVMTSLSRDSDVTPQQILAAENWFLISDEDEIRKAVNFAIENNEEIVKKFFQLHKNPKKQQRPLNKLVKIASLSMRGEVATHKITTLLKTQLENVKEKYL